MWERVPFLMEEGQHARDSGSQRQQGETGQRGEVPRQILGPSEYLGFAPSESGAMGAEGCDQLDF